MGLLNEGDVVDEQQEAIKVLKQWIDDIASGNVRVNFITIPSTDHTFSEARLFGMTVIITTISLPQGRIDELRETLNAAAGVSKSTP